MNKLTLLSLALWIACAETTYAQAVPKLRHWTVGVGVTRKGTALTAAINSEDLNLATTKFRILLIGGMKGRDKTLQSVITDAKWFYSKQKSGSAENEFLLSAIGTVNPHGIGDKRDPRGGYPPKGRAYDDRHNPEAGYLWRWLGMHAPDLVVVIRESPGKQGWVIPKSPLTSWLKNKLPNAKFALESSDSLANQLVRNRPSETGSIPAVQFWSTESDKPLFLPQLIKALRSSPQRMKPSPARLALQRRLKRSPVQVAKQLSKTYGHDLRSVVYIPALALIARIRLSKLTGDPSHLRDVERIVDPYVRGKKTNPRSGSGLSGHLVFCELAQVSRGKKRATYLKLARNSADLGLNQDGSPKKNMPFHVEMSDSVFMGGPILARVGALTGNKNYFTACVNHLRFMRKVDLRKDGIYRHSPLDQAAWGRGNGFPAIGVAMCLTHFPKDHPHRSELIREFRNHMISLAKYQDPNGCWHQVIDKPASYRELTSTCMITFAMVRGMRLKVLDEKTYEPIVQRAWYAIKTRVRADGRLVDVCTGTGKQQSLRAYYDRPAILGPDARGGAMALLVSTELAQWEKERSK